MASLPPLLWNSVNLTAKRQAEAGQPGAAMDWLGKMPFARADDYAQAIANVLTVWDIKSPAEATAWIQNAALDPAVKTEALRARRGK